MKKLSLLVLMVVVAASAQVWASGNAEDELSGTWYGGSESPDHAGFKYQYVIVPTGPDQWGVTAHGAYNADSIGAAVKTPWAGEVAKNGDEYELRLIALTTNDPVDPPEELPTIQAVRAMMSIDSEGVGHITYDFYALYTWDQIPYVDEPATWVLEPGAGEIKETMHRVQTEVAYH